MRIIRTKELSKERVVECPNGGFTSRRILLDSDSTGFGMHRTSVPKGEKQYWHYKHHLEACYCISGTGHLTNANTGEVFDVVRDTTYVVGKDDPHFFQALEDVELLCVFNPPLVGREIHGSDGAYALNDQWRSPVYAVRSVPMDSVVANDYNPNRVAPPEMELLETSIWEDGYTQPIVTYYDEQVEKYIVVDGFHRHLTMQRSERIREREKGMLPVVVIDKAIGERMASTIRHNRARGTHNIELMSGIVAELVEIGKSDRWICKHIGMSLDELLRLKQLTGLAALFANKTFSESWEVEELDEVQIEDESDAA